MKGVTIRVESAYDGKKPHKCSICDYRYSQKSNLTKHLKSVHEEKKPNKPHKCSVCDYSFSQAHHLRRHMESVHEERKPHKCPICDTSFSPKKLFEKTCGVSSCW